MTNSTLADFNLFQFRVTKDSCGATVARLPSLDDPNTTNGLVVMGDGNIFSAVESSAKNRVWSCELLDEPGKFFDRVRTNI